MLIQEIIFVVKCKSCKNTAALLIECCRGRMVDKCKLHQIVSRRLWEDLFISGALFTRNTCPGSST